jgi:phosphohistidine swiveling domain-containing protein
MILGPGDTPDLARMGGKAFALAQLGSDFPVPPWRVVPPESDDFESPGLFSDLGPGPYAVRSSAVEEDAGAHSFAGQLQSFLDVPAAEVAGRIRAVRDSAHSDSALAYRRLHRLPGAPSVPAVLVQQMVPADFAGTAFSVDPIDGRRVAINAVRGLADQLASGAVDGDTYRLDREGGPVPARAVGAGSLLPDDLQKAVADLALRAEARFGRPQDIEWAIAQGRLYLLQSRPITALEDATLWDNSNIVESYSGPTLPLTFSFARHAYAGVYRAFCRLLGVPARAIDDNAAAFDNMLGCIDGHVYYNLLHWYRTLALLPGFAVNRRFMEQMMGVSAALPREVADRLAPKAGGLAARLRLGWSALRLLAHAIRLPRTIARFQLRLDAALEACPPTGDLPTLAARYRGLEAMLLRRWDAPLINDFLCMIAFGASRALLRRWCGSDELHNELMIGQGDIVSAEPSRRIARMADMVRGDPSLVAMLRAGDTGAIGARPDLQQAIADYLLRFGDRCTEELKLESVTLDDDPTPLLLAIGHYAARPPAGPSPARPDLARSLAGHPLRRMVARRVLAWAGARVRDRENLRLQRTRVFGRVRRIFLEIGRHFARAGVLARARDIFYLEVGEVLGLIEGAWSLGEPQALVALRRAAAPAQSPPNRFWTHGAACLSRREDVAAGVEIREHGGGSANHGDDRRDDRRRQGLGCCPGHVRATVRVIRDPRRQSLLSGEILVARHTDPGWIALFSNAAGILVERGSLLSHSAIVARELGIPAVVGVAGLLDWLRTGDVVELDGRTGSVVRVHDASP